MINKMTLFPSLGSSGTFDKAATLGIKTSFFEGSNDGTTYTRILTIEDEPPQVESNCPRLECPLVSCRSFLAPSSSLICVCLSSLCRVTAHTTRRQAT
jgi:hypothetical protein